MRFILIDDIIALSPGTSIEAVKTLPADEELFRDHFPGFPVVPGVLLTEMMAQAAGKCLDAADPERGKAMLVQIRKASFRKWVRPGERVDIHAEITASAQDYATGSCRVTVNGADVAQAELMFSFVKSSQLAPDYRDEVLARFLNRGTPGQGGRPA